MGYRDDWESVYKGIVQADEGWLHVQHLASPLEREEKRIKRAGIVKRNRDKIIAGMYAIYKKAGDEVIYAEKRMDSAQKDEILDWDPEVLSAEIKLAQARVDNAIHSKSITSDVSARFNGLILEASISKDKYKVRALASALDSANVKGLELDDRRVISGIASTQIKIANALRTSDKMKEAKLFYDEKFDYLQSMKRYVNQISMTIDEGDGTHPLSKNDASIMFREFASRNDGESAKKTLDDVIKFYHK